MNTSKAPTYNQNKGYESNAQEKKNLMKMPGAFKQMSSISKHMSTPTQMGGSKTSMMMKDKMGGPKMMGSVKGGDSPNKNLGMKYDIKEASNMNLTPSARRNYARNAQSASKEGYTG